MNTLKKIILHPSYLVAKARIFGWKLRDLYDHLLPQEYITTFCGHKFYIDRWDSFWTKRWLYEYEKFGMHESNTAEIFKEYIKKGDIVLDIGASFGVLTMLASELVGDSGEVIAIEANPKHFYYLCKNKEINNYKNITPYLLAAWDKEGYAFIDATTNKKKKEVAVNSMPIDYITDKADFIKMDIDGGEPLALKGMEKLIKSSPSLKMVIEYYPSLFARYGGSDKSYTDFLKKYFDIYIIPGEYGNGYWNLFCIRKGCGDIPHYKFLKTDWHGGVKLVPENLYD